jgi:hypothetical protein
MCTADRKPKTNYLAGTLDRLFAQGLEPSRLHLCATAPDVAWLQPMIAKWPVTLHVPEKKLSRVANGLASIRAVSGEDFDWLLLLEDDLAFCSDFLGSVERWLDAHARPDRAVHQFFGFHRVPPGKPAAFDVSLVKLRAAEAVALRREDAMDLLAWGEAHLLTWRRLEPWGATNAPPSEGWDKLIATWSLLMWPKRPGLMSHPHFVRHVGKESSLHRYGPANDGCFAGDRWSYQPQGATA